MAHNTTQRGYLNTNLHGQLVEEAEEFSCFQIQIHADETFLRFFFECMRKQFIRNLKEIAGRWEF